MCVTRRERNLTGASVLRGINNNYKDIREILKTQREKSLEEIHEILKEREKEIQRRARGHLKEAEGAYAIQRKGNRRCYTCGKGGHLAKVCWHRGSRKGETYKATNTYTRREGRKDSDVNRENTEKKSASNIAKSTDGK